MTEEVQPHVNISFLIKKLTFNNVLQLCVKMMALGSIIYCMSSKKLMMMTTCLRPLLAGIKKNAPNPKIKSQTH